MPGNRKAFNQNILNIITSWTNVRTTYKNCLCLWAVLNIPRFVYEKFYEQIYLYTGSDPKQAFIFDMIWIFWILTYQIAWTRSECVIVPASEPFHGGHFSSQHQETVPSENLPLRHRSLWLVDTLRRVAKVQIFHLKLRLLWTRCTHVKRSNSTCCTKCTRPPTSGTCQEQL